MWESLYWHWEISGKSPRAIYEYQQKLEPMSDHNYV